MKKSFLSVVSLLLVLVLMLGVFASCNNTTDTPNEPSGNEDANTSDDNTGDNTGDNTDDNTGDNAGDNTGDNTGDNNGGEQGGEETPKDIVWSIDGKDGKSGYQLAVDSGFGGTLEEWLDHFANTEDAAKAEELRELLVTKHQLRVNEDGSFKVLVLSDVQSNSTRLNESTIKNIETICEREQPDLVIFNGDNSFDIRNSRSLTTYITVMSKWCEENKVPWAHVYGNHDDETPVGEVCVPKEAQQVIYESFEYCVSKAGDPDIAGIGNFVLPVYTNDGKSIAFNVWALDSGSYAADADIIDHVNVGGNYFYGHYEGMKENQAEWYYDASQMLEEYNGGKVTGMMTFHIPLQEVWTAWSQKEALGLEWTGEKRENISASAKPVKLFNKVLSRKDVKLIVNSHDHINDFAVTYKGVTFAYTACIGTTEYNAPDMLGGRVINFSTATPDNLETYMSYVNERTDIGEKPTVDNETPILQLQIGDDGTVTNAVEDGIKLVSKDYAGADKKVSKDSEINKNVITFKGNTNKPSVYNMSATSIVSTLADGFSYEVMFKITDNTFTSNYVGVLDFEESGGFGLDIYKSSDTSKAVIYAEVAYASAWNSLKYTIDLDKWYHVVYSYDGTTAVLYVNGVEVAKETLNGTFRAPSFASRTGEEYICIGGCAQAWHQDARSTGINGMTGSIAIANIFAKPLTAAEATALYNAAK